MNFNQKFTDRLFVAATQTSDIGFIAFIIPAARHRPVNDVITLKEALSSQEYFGSFVFGAIGPDISTASQAIDFIEKIDPLLSNNTRKFIWITHPNNISESTITSAEVNARAKEFQTALTINLTNSLTLTIQSGMEIKLDDDASALLLEGGTNNFQIQFGGTNTPTMQRVVKGKIAFSGALRGCVQFTGFIQRTSLIEDLNMGFQIIIPNGKTGEPPLSEWLPFANPSNGPADFLGFNISIDPSDLYNAALDPCSGNSCSMSTAYSSRRSFFDFTGKDFNDNVCQLQSNYSSVFGAPVTLIPGTSANVTYNARLVLSLGEIMNNNTGQHFQLSPEGDFMISFGDNPLTENNYLACGLSGTEFFTITPHIQNKKGDLLRFISRQPAYIKKFPYPTSSPVGPPTDPTASPFDKTYLTSWATLINNSGNNISFVSQPKGSALFGSKKKNPSFIKKGRKKTNASKTATLDFPDLFDHSIPSFQFQANNELFFPMLPYSGFDEKQNSLDATVTQQIENTVLSPQRRLIVSKLSKTNAHLFEEGSLVGKTVLATTPSGLIAKTTQDDGNTAVRWDEIQLGWNVDKGTKYTMAFENPTDPLINALQSSDVFLIAANNTNIGALGGAANGPGFQNTMSLSSWGMQANIGTDQKYGDYRNIMIFKGRKGKLFDPKSSKNSLVASPKKWTQSSEFAIPQITDHANVVATGDDQQLIILSQWLQTYFEDAQKQEGNPYFKKFNDIATSETWTGILFLKIDIKSLPENLKGITAGITNQAAFNAHHLGIEISPVKKGVNGPVVEKPSSIFGLIYYMDPDFADIKPTKSIAPTNADTYDFRLLSLKVLFENTSVKSFESYAQLTLNRLFGSLVSKMGDPENIYKNVLLAGSLQINNGKAVYALSSQNDDAFYLNNNIINKIEITNVLLSTRSGKDATTIVSWFGISGFIDFFSLTNTTKAVALDTDLMELTDDTNFDIFSFGNILGEDKLKKGLNFANLGIQMSFPGKNPTDSKLEFKTNEITFDVSISTPRKNSLYLNMVLDLKSLEVGTKDKGSKEAGFLDVIPDLRLGGVSDGDWYGLKFKLNMGTPGELAGKVSLDSYFLMSWSPDSNQAGNYKAGIGIALPGTGGGAKIISLQNVMKLSIGQIRLSYIAEQDSFLLLFTTIALKFLGLLKIPPNGNTTFYLFGNPKAGGKASGLGWYAVYSKEPQSKGNELIKEQSNY
ncbi:hypothetical protein [Changchengzhania lutea]|uniref:hypothetical protein n=1 Tax=Changchengzhania lutea TaxID=2049305 RepID=UPI00115E8604|nr:hypothetical protein [Changchengzhania lutea]